MQFEATLQQDPDGTWWFVHVPKKIRDEWKHLEKRGIIHVAVTIGRTTWEGSMLPWADGSAQIAVNKKIRTQEHLSLGDMLTVMVHPTES